MNVDIQYTLSHDALKGLYNEAGRMGLPIAAAFRRKAHAFTRARKPEFCLSGGDLKRNFSAGVHPDVYAKLVRITERMGVPIACIGELVASFDMESQ